MMEAGYLLLFVYEFYDQHLGKVVYTCKASCNRTANIMFKRETGADPMQLTYIQRNLIGHERRIINDNGA